MNLFKFCYLVFLDKEPTSTSILKFVNVIRHAYRNDWERIGPLAKDFIFPYFNQTIQRFNLARICRSFAEDLLDVVINKRVSYAAVSDVGENNSLNKDTDEVEEEVNEEEDDSGDGDESGVRCHRLIYRAARKILHPRHTSMSSEVYLE